MRRRRLLAVAPAGLLLSQPVLRRAGATETLSVLLDWFVNPNHAPLIVAEQMGAFHRRGLAVDLVQPADPTMPPRLVAAGHGDIAISYQTTLYRQVLGGLPIVRIGALQDRSLVSLCALRSRGITKLADLKGKRLGYNDIGGDVSLAALDVMLRTVGLSVSQTSLVNVGTALTTSLLTGRVDAVTIVRNFESFEIEDHGETPIVFDYESYGVPPSDGFIYEVRSDRAGDPRLPRFLAAVKEATAYLRSQPVQAWAMILRAYPDLDDKLNRQAWEYTRPYFAADPAALDEAKYRRFAEFLLAHKVISQVPPVARYAVRLGYPPA